MYEEDKFITAESLYWPEILRKDVTKSRTALQPIYEAFTNSIEAIRDRKIIEPNIKGKIIIKVYSTESTEEGKYIFSHLSITDNGIGFNNEQLERFNKFRDIRKNYKNLGSGRIQYVHYFDKVFINSIFKENDELYQREFIVSKNQIFLDHNAIVKHKYCKSLPEGEIGTTVRFNRLIEESLAYNELTAITLKRKLQERYLQYFCNNRSNLPNIQIEHFLHKARIEKTTISIKDIPEIDEQKSIKIHYKKFTGNGFKEIERNEEFLIDAFKIDKGLLSENKLNFVSKGEVVEESHIELESLAANDYIKGGRFLFLVSSKFIDERDTPLRGVLKIMSRENYSKDVFSGNNEEIFLEDIQKEVNTTINSMYPEFEIKKKKHFEEFEELKEMFLLDEATAQDIHISINDSERDILKKYYEAEAKKTANIDAEIKESIDSLKNLDTTSSNYNDDLEERVQNLVTQIPLQNKVSLTKYVARRKLVLNLFDLIISRKLDTQINEKRNKDEKLLHNLIFQQSNLNTSSIDSDLWLINEDFIYFKGVSEKALNDIEIDGVKLLRTDLSEEEKEYRKSLTEDRYQKRPDILLFPEEGKCLIIEFKNPNQNVSDYLNQISSYAALIWNFANPKFEFNAFYGYLIGEKINAHDVRSRDSDFHEAYHFDYLYRPNKPVPGFFSKEGKDAHIYTEVIKYSTLCKRAKRRNQIFIDKLRNKT